MIPHEILGTIPGWITSAGVLSLLGLYFRFYTQNRKLSLDGDAKLRDHYAQEVERLREFSAKEIAALREQLAKQATQFREDLQNLENRYRRMLDEAEERHDSCIADRDGLRKRVAELEDDWRGLLRVVTQASIDKVLMIPGLSDDMPGDMRDMAERVEQIIHESGKKA